MLLDISPKKSAPLRSREGSSLSALPKKVSYRVLGFVAFLHAIIFLFITFGLPDFKFKKRPDITIEIGAAPPASSGPVNQAKTTPAPAPVQKEAPKEKTPPPSKDKDAPSIPVPAQAPPSSAQPVAPSSGGVASAPTADADADYKAAYLQNPKPPYPPLAFKARIEGKVILIAEVQPDGRAGQVRVLESSDNEMLDQAALSTVRQWRFTPARKDGVIVTQAVRIPITFSLKNR
jgi:protein TonB